MRGQRVVVAAGVLGLAVLTVFLVISSLTSVNTARIDSFQRTDDPRKLVMNLTIGFGVEIAERTVREDAKAVRITVGIRSSYDPAPASAVYVPVLVSLKDALGDRAVLDADGRVVRDLGEIYRPPGTPPRP